MPVTTYPSPLKTGRNRDHQVTTASALLEKTSHAWCGSIKWAQSNKKKGPEDRPIIQTSFPPNLNNEVIIPYANGFVDGVLRAFNQDLHLVLRPDDVWLAILTQFNFFVNGKAEILRSQFVTHEGKKTLAVDFTPFPLKSVDMGKVAQEMTSLIQENVIDPELKKWILPDFTTTDDNDRSVASIVMMGSFQSYFEYLMLCGCGFPSVTLLGEKKDWEDIRKRLDKLPQYHAETAEWTTLLIPTLNNMIHTFDEPESKRTHDFWMRTGFEAGQDGGSGFGFATLSGWITAFCFWGDDGKRISGRTDEMCARVGRDGTTLEQRKRLVLDGVRFPMISPKDVPRGVVTVPVIVKDFLEGMKVNTTMVAGLVGVTLTGKKEGKGDTVQPRSGWWMLEDGREKLVDGDEDLVKKQTGSETTSTEGEVIATPSTTDDDDLSDW